MDNVLIESKEVEQQALGKKKALLFAGSGFNGGSSARPGVPVRFDRDWFGGLDWGDSVGSFALAAQLRYGAITDRKVRELENRLEFYPSIITPSVLFGQHEWMRLRADSAVFGVSEQYGWVRGMLEIGSDLSPQLTACFGVASSFDWGSPHFDADRLYSEHALHFRTDLKLPASKLSILAKYDMDRKKLYDVEITLRQSIRSLEPFISYRSFPGSLSFGLSLRMDKLLKALQARRD